MITSRAIPIDPAAAERAADDRTDIRVRQLDGRPRTRLRSGLLRAQPVGAPPGWTKIGLIANTALLLGGDQVELSVEVGPGARLWLFDVAGTVAYHGRGRGAGWRVRARVAAGGQLIMTGEPFVVSAGASVDRSLELDVDGQALIRETVVIGRSGEVGGRLRSRTSIGRLGVPVALEDQRLDLETRRLPGVLGDQRVIDTITRVGDPAGTLAPTAGAATFAMPDDAGGVLRWIGTDLAASPIHAAWTSALDQALAPLSPAFAP